MNTSQIAHEIVAVSETFRGYDCALKQRLTQLERLWLKALAVHLELPRGSFDLHVNQAGVAVAADVTLHTEQLYVQFSDCFGMGYLGLLVRGCYGRRDYGSRGHPNCWIGRGEFEQYHLGEIAMRILSITGAHPDILARLRASAACAIAA